MSYMYVQSIWLLFRSVEQRPSVVAELFQLCQTISPICGSDPHRRTDIIANQPA